ncbi:MAG TPA: hypothetical protein VMU39_00845 [Solirubrobacteraceae bacterium]|nr:hypothetical protein [Solirubrobacteraceae bacterium]
MAKTDTLLAHCIAQAIIHDAGGEAAARARYGANGEALASNKWQAFRVAARVTPKASRVASFIALWGLALYDLGRNELTVDEYAEWASESRATSFRRQGEYRELWPDRDLNELAGHVRDYLRDHQSARRNPSRLTSVAVAL